MEVDAVLQTVQGPRHNSLMPHWRLKKTTQPEREPPTPETETEGKKQNMEEDQGKIVEPLIQIRHKYMQEECGKYLRDAESK